jgi:hypothetical protein
LPKADVVVITWTAAEVDALADIFTCPYHIPTGLNITKNNWYLYDRNFQSKYKNQIRRGAPSRGPSDNVNMLGSYYLCDIGDKKILCFKSQLHVNQDKIK